MIHPLSHYPLSEANKIMLRDAKIGNFIDIGANIGVVADPMAKRLIGTSYKLYCIEPDDEALSHLRNNMKDYNNVEIHPIAITEKDSKIRLFTSQMGGHTTNEYSANTRKWNYDPNKFRENIDSLTLDTFVERNNITNITAIKLDVEAGEQFVLQGGKKTFTENKLIMALETHDNIDCVAIFNILRDYGYVVYDTNGVELDHIRIGVDYICKNY